MYLIDAAKERMEPVEVFEIPGLFTAKQIDRATVPRGMYAYDLETENGGCPSRIAPRIAERRFGTVLTASPIMLPGSGSRDMASGDFIQNAGEAQLTTTEFEDKYLSPYAG